MDGSVVMEPLTRPYRTPTSSVEIKSINLACKAAEHTAPLPGASSTACSRMTASGLKASARPAPGR